MSALERALKSGERFGVLGRAFVAGERFREFAMEPRRVGRLTVKSNRVAVVDPFGLGFGFKTLTRKVPRGRFPVEIAIAHYRKGPRKGEQRVALARIRLGKGKATGYRLADVPDQPERRWLGATFGGYPVESGFGAFACGDAAKALDTACGAAFDEGELDHPQSRMLRDQLTHAEAQARGWGSGELVPVLREGSLVAFTAGHGEGFYPSYWGYDDERRLVSLVTDFLVLPTDPELIRETWAGRTWRELHYDGDRGQRFWRVKVKGRVRTIEHGHVGKRGQSNTKEFTTSEAALEGAAKGIHRQLDAGYFELSSSASDLRHAMSGVAPKLREGRAPSRRDRKRAPKERSRRERADVLVETKRQAGKQKPKTSRGGSPKSTASKKRKDSKGAESHKAGSKPKPASKSKRPAKPEPKGSANTKPAKPSKSAKRAATPEREAQKGAVAKKRGSAKKDKAKSAAKKQDPGKKDKAKAKPAAKKQGPGKKDKAKPAAKKQDPGKKDKGKPATNGKPAKSKSASKKPSGRSAKLKAKAPAARPRRW